MFNVCLSYAILSVPCSLVVTCWERTDLLCVVLLVFFHFPKWCSRSGVVLECSNGVPGQAWYLNVQMVFQVRCGT